MQLARWSRSVAAVTVICLLSATGVTAAQTAASASPPVSALAAGAAHPKAAPAPTTASLQVLSPASHVGRAVSFSLSSSHVRAGRHLASAVLSFGDGTTAKVGSLARVPVHVYRRAGSFLVSLTLRDSAHVRSIARTTLVITGKNVAVLKKTTMRLSAPQIIAVTPIDVNREILILHGGVKAPAIGHALLVSRGSLLPQGLVAVVQGVSHNSDGTTTVTAKDGGLSDAYSKLAIADTSSVGRSLAVTHTAPSGARSLLAADEDTAVPFSCDIKGDKSVKVTVDLSKTNISTVIDLQAKIFQLDVISKPVFTLGVEFSGEATCSLSNSFAINIPVPSVPGLIVSVAPYFKLSATGAVAADFTWHPAVFLDVLRAPKTKSSNFLKFFSSADASATGSATVTLEGGLKVAITVGKAVGLEATIGPKIEATASISGSTSAGTSACIDVSSAVEAEVDLFADVLFYKGKVVLYSGEFDRTDLLHKCTTSGGTPSGSGSGQGTTTGGGPAGSGGDGAGSAPYTGPSTPETTGGQAHTYTDYVHAGGAQGQDIQANQTVDVVCRILGFKVADGNTWWYEIGSEPWNAAYFVSADAFYNNGQTSGSLHGTPFDDPAVPVCAGSAGAPPVAITPPVTGTTVTAGGYLETTGGVTHTWTDYTDAGGTQGPSIPSNTGVQVLCQVTGFRVSDGDTAWYQVGSAPWNGAYYASADAFYNDGQTSGSLNGTPLVDLSVPACTATTPTPAPAPVPAPTPAPTPAGVLETTGGATNTWTDYTNAGGSQGPTIAGGQSVYVTCRLNGFQVADGDTWWYQIASGPWSNSYYASADAFYNDGATSGSLHGTPLLDPAVPVCGNNVNPTPAPPSAPTPPPPPTYTETPGGQTHTWTNYTNAGGSEGPSIGTSQSVQISCRLTGFTVADGDTWWYRIASSPWNNSYYASADAFYNDGATSGSLHGTPFVDANVPLC